MFMCYNGCFFFLMIRRQPRYTRTYTLLPSRRSSYLEDVHALRPHPGQVRVAANRRSLLSGSTLADIPYHLVPKFRSWQPSSWDGDDARALNFDICWEWVPFSQRHGREKDRKSVV